MANGHEPAAASYPAAPPTPEAPRRRRSRWLTIGLPVGLLLLAGIAVGAGFAISAIKDAIGPAQQATESYATALVEGRWDEAQRQLCSTDRATITADALAGQFSSSELTGYRIEGITVSSSNGVTSGEARVVFTTSTGLDSTTLLPLEKDGEIWRPCP